MRTLLPLSLACLLAVFATACNVVTYKAETMLSQSTPHLADSAVDIQTKNGRVSVLVSPHREDVMIEATMRCAGASQQEADQRLSQAALDVSRDTGRTLVIRPVFPGGYRNGDACSFKVLMPGVQDVTVDTSNGELEFDGTAGLIDARTSNGRITATAHDGEIRARTSNGRITVVDATGPLDLDTSNGRVEVTNAADTVRIDTSNGRVKLVLAPQNDEAFEISSSNGGIELVVGPGYDGAIDLNTSNGRISVADEARRARRTEIGKSHGRVEIGDGAADSIARTSNGSITVTLAADAGESMGETSDED